MASKTELRVVLSVDGEAKFTSTMERIKRQQSELKSAYAKASSELSNNAKAYERTELKAKKLTDEIKLQREKVDLLRDAYEKSAAKGESAAETTSKLKSEYDSAAAKLNKLEKELDTTNKKLAEQKSNWTKNAEELNKYGSAMEKVGDKAKAVGDKMSKYITAPIMAMGTYAAKSAIDFEEAYAGVLKTVDGTEEQLSKLREDILNMSTELPSSANEIAGVAEAAGQLGIQTENVAAFSEQMIKLGMSTNLSANDAATSLARFANITEMSQTDFEKLGSSIVDLGNNFATTESEIVNMALRLAGAGHQVGMSEGDILGLATALSSVGIEAEMGGSAISKAMVKMQNAVEAGGGKMQAVLDQLPFSLRELELMSANHSKDFKEWADSIGMTSTELNRLIKSSTELEDFAAISGMSAKEFQQAWEKDAAGALTAFIKGLGNAEEKGESAIALLSEMGISEVRLRDSLLRAANAGNLLSDSIEMGNSAWEKNQALQTEVNKRLETTGSKMQIAKNQLTMTAIEMGDTFLPTIADVCKEIGELAKGFRDLNPQTQQFIVKLALVAAAAGPVLSVGGRLTSTAGSLLKGISNIMKTVGAIKAGTYTGPLANLLTSLGKTKGAVEGVEGALETASTSGQKVVDTFVELGTSSGTAAAGASGLGSILAAGGPLLVGLAAVTAAVGLAYAEYRKMTEGTRELGAELDEFSKALGIHQQMVDGATSALSGLNSEIWISSERQAAFKEQITGIEAEITSIVQAASEARRGLTENEIARLQELFDKLNEITEQELEYQRRQQEVVKTMAELETNMTRERAAELEKAAEDQMNATIEMSTQKYAEQLLLLQQAFEAEDGITQEEYDKRKKALEENHAEEVESVRQKYADTLSAIEEGYFNQNIANDEHLQKLFELNETRKKIMDEYKEITSTGLDQDGQAWRAYQDQKNIIDKQIKSEMEQLSDDALAYWLGQVATVETYGGKVSDKASETANNFIDAFDDLPEKSKKTFQDALQGMLDGIAQKAGSLYDKASEVAGTFVNRIKNKFESRSPSKLFRRMFSNDIVGAMELGVDDEKRGLYGKANEIANGFKKRFEGMSPEIRGGIAEALDGLERSGLRAQLAAAGNFATRLTDRATSVVNTSNSDSHNVEVHIDALMKIENFNGATEKDLMKLAKQLEALGLDMNKMRGLKV